MMETQYVYEQTQPFPLEGAARVIEAVENNTEQAGWKCVQVVFFGAMPVQQSAIAQIGKQAVTIPMGTIIFRHTIVNGARPVFPDIKLALGGKEK